MATLAAILAIGNPVAFDASADDRDTRGFIKVVIDDDTGRILGITAVAKDAGELAAASVFLLDGQRTYHDVATMWVPYLTMAEGIRLTANLFRNELPTSCCA